MLPSIRSLLLPFDSDEFLLTQLSFAVPSVGNQFPAFFRDTVIHTSDIWRQGFRVYHRTTRADEAACVREMGRTGATLPQLCGLLVESARPGEADLSDGGAPPDPTRRMAGLLDRWLAEGLIRGRRRVAGRS